MKNAQLTFVCVAAAAGLFVSGGCATKPNPAQSAGRPGRAASLDVRLILAAKAGRAAAVQEFLAQGAHVNGVGGEGRTALMCAVGKGHIEVVGLLLRSGSDAGLRERDGSTALMWAAGSGHNEAVSLLLADR